MPSTFIWELKLHFSALIYKDSRTILMTIRFAFVRYVIFFKIRIMMGQTAFWLNEIKQLNNWLR